MKVIEYSTEIARSPQEVFDYVSDAARLPEWQPSVEAAAAEPPAIRQVGMLGYEVRRVPGGRQKAAMAGHRVRTGWALGDRGHRWTGRAHTPTISLAPSDGVGGTQVDYRIWFEGHGIGRLFRVMAGRGARAEVPESLELLKQRLETVAV